MGIRAGILSEKGIWRVRNSLRQSADQGVIDPKSEVAIPVFIPILGFYGTVIFCNRLNIKMLSVIGSAYGNRTRLSALRGPCPNR